MSQKSIYLVVFNIVAYDELRVQYWLKKIRTFGGFESQIVFIGTHLEDRNCTREVRQDINSRIDKFKRKFNVKEVCFVSCTRETGFTKLNDVLMDIAKDHPYVRYRVPEYYLVRALLSLLSVT